MPNTRHLVATTALNTKISEFENKIPDSYEYITTQGFNKLTAKKFAARLRQADLVNKTDNKLTSFNKQITSHRTKKLEVQKKLNSLITKGYNFRLSNNESQNRFFYQTTLDTLELKKDKGTDYGLRGKSQGVFNWKLK